jgi:hypothetical protein
LGVIGFYHLVGNLVPKSPVPFFPNWAAKESMRDRLEEFLPTLDAQSPIDTTKRFAQRIVLFFFTWRVKFEFNKARRFKFVAVANHTPRDKVAHLASLSFLLTPTAFQFLSLSGKAFFAAPRASVVFPS